MTNRNPQPPDDKATARQSAEPMADDGPTRMHDEELSTESTADFEIEKPKPSVPPTVIEAAPTRPKSKPKRPSNSDAEISGPPLPRFGRYVLLEQLGVGGMGEVYRALHTRLHKQVALKLLPGGRAANRAARERFQREIQLISRLSHPNVVRLENAGEIDGRPYLVMEYVPGLNLKQLLARVGPLRPADACQIVGQAAVGLAHLHQHRLLHRDLKPSNLIFSTADGSVKIADLGVARLAEGTSEITGSGKVVGDPHYMAPEQIEGTALDIRADIYGLGCTLFTLLTGKPPFNEVAGDIPEILRGHLQRPFPRLAGRCAEASSSLQRVLDQMVARRAVDRLERPADVAAALAPLAVGCDLSKLIRSVDATSEGADTGGSHSGIHSAEYLSLHAPARRKHEASGRRRRWAAVAVAAAVLLLAIPFALYWAGLWGAAATETAPAGVEAPAAKSSPSADRPGATPPPQAAAAEAEPARGLFALIEPLRDTFDAEPVFDGEQLEFGVEGEFAVVQLPLLPRGDYTIEATVERVAGEGSFWLGFNVGAGRLVAAIDQNQNGKTTSGLAYFSPAGVFTVIQPQPGRLAVVGEPLKIRVEVTPQRAVLKVADPLGGLPAPDAPAGSSSPGEPAWLTSRWEGEPAEPKLAVKDAYYPEALLLRSYNGRFRVSDLKLTGGQGEFAPLTFAGLEAHPGRRLAEWVLWRGGELRIREEHEGESRLRTVRRWEELPAEPRIVAIGRRNHSPVPTSAWPDTRFSGAPFRLAQQATELERVDMRNSDADDADLAALSGLPKLKVLILGNSRVTAAGVRQLEALPALTNLFLNNLALTDDDLAVLRRFPTLSYLCLSGCPITDAGVARVVPALPRLEHLCLNSTKVEGDCLNSLTGLDSLRELQLSSTAIDDNDLPPIEELQELERLVLSGTGVSDEAAGRLRARHPQWTIVR